ncbi:SigE family RNA polymerase sigma factor [Actinophytocola sp.]|uniref:SigE family RNA polymerase sigma factor n=1 Tax=Actinophytocola sp. TaxID=1872138 RepID=UPI002EDA09AA
MHDVDERQYTEYVTRRLPTLRRTAYLLCGDEHRADDLVQSTITKLYLHWRRASAADSVDAYVRAMLVRTFLSEQRLGWAKRVRLTSTPQDTAVAGPDVETRLVLQHALARIGPKVRAVLVLRFLLDLPVAEVAAVLRCSEGNVKSQTSVGLAALRRLLADHLPEGVRS